MGWYHAEEWRWNVDRHRKPTSATITVTDLSDDAKADRDRKVRQGAEVVPFGFSRVIARAEREQALESAANEAWEGMGLMASSKIEVSFKFDDKAIERLFWMRVALALVARPKGQG